MPEAWDTRRNKRVTYGGSMTDDIPAAGKYDGPNAELHQAYMQSVAAVHAPPEHLDGFQAVTREAEAAIKAANKARAKIDKAEAKAKAGSIHRDQVAILRQRAIEEAAKAVEDHRALGVKLAQALPDHLLSQVFPAPERGAAAITDAKSDLRLWADSVSPEDVDQAIVARFTDAVDQGDYATAQVLLSSFGADLYRSKAGPHADSIWPDLRAGMLEQAGRSRDRLPDAARSALDALDQTVAVEQASMAGHTLAHFLIEDLRVGQPPRLDELKPVSH